MCVCSVQLDCSRSKKTWVTDMAVMPNIHKLVLGFTNSILCEFTRFSNGIILLHLSTAAVYDLSTPAFDKLFQITGLYHCPLALHHW